MMTMVVVEVEVEVMTMLMEEVEFYLNTQPVISIDPFHSYSTLKVEVGAGRTSQEGWQMTTKLLKAQVT